MPLRETKCKKIKKVFFGITSSDLISDEKLVSPSVPGSLEGMLEKPSSARVNDGLVFFYGLNS